MYVGAVSAHRIAISAPMVKSSTKNKTQKNAMAQELSYAETIYLLCVPAAVQRRKLFF